MWIYSSRSCKCKEQFNEAFTDIIVSDKTFSNHKNRVVKRFEEKHCICKDILTEEDVANIAEHIHRSPNKSIRKLSAQSRLPYSSCRKVLKERLHMHPYKISAVQQLHEIDYRGRLLSVV